MDGWLRNWGGSSFRVEHHFCLWRVGDMTTSRRLMVVAAVLASAAILSQARLAGEPAGNANPAQNPLAADNKAGTGKIDQQLENLAAAKFSQDGVLTYQTKE